MGNSGLLQVRSFDSTPRRPEGRPTRTYFDLRRSALFVQGCTYAVMARKPLNCQADKTIYDHRSRV